jgi:hypothetical protein
MDNLTAGDLSIDALPLQHAAPVTLVLRGRSNDRQPARVLGPYFTEALELAHTRGVPLELHFEELEHFNSSTITSLIQLVQDAAARDVRLIYVYDQGLRWQRLNFEALRVFSSDGLLELRSVYRSV